LHLAGFGSFASRVLRPRRELLGEEGRIMPQDEGVGFNKIGLNLDALEIAERIMRKIDNVFSVEYPQGQSAGISVSRHESTAPMLTVLNSSLCDKLVRELAGVSSTLEVEYADREGSE